MLATLKSLWILPQTKSEKGQDLAEYGLLLMLIAIVVVVAVLLLGAQILAFWDWIISHWPVS